MDDFFKNFKMKVMLSDDFNPKRSLELSVSFLLNLYTLFDSNQFGFDNEMDDISIIDDEKEWKI